MMKVTYEDDVLFCGKDGVTSQLTDFCEFHYDENYELIGLSIDKVHQILRLYSDFCMDIVVEGTNLCYFLFGASRLDKDYKTNEAQYKEALAKFGKFSH